MSRTDDNFVLLHHNDPITTLTCYVLLTKMSPKRILYAEHELSNILPHESIPFMNGKTSNLPALIVFQFVLQINRLHSLQSNKYWNRFSYVIVLEWRA